MSNKIKLGIVGLGRIGMQMANKEISSFPELYEIVAVCDLIESRAKDLGERVGAKMYTDYAEMLNQEVTNIHGINETLNVVSEVVDSNSATSQETAAVSEEQKAQVETMAQLVEFFKI